MRIACIDIGGTNIKAGILQNGELTAVCETATQAHRGADTLLRTVTAIVREMPPVECAGISTAGEVDPQTGIIRLSDNIPGYTGMHVREKLTQMLGMPVAVENDVNAAALGEYVFGSAQGISNFLMVNYGTGIGGAVILNGALYRGENGSAGEFGGILIHGEDVVDNDRGSGSYERYASTSALVAQAQALHPMLSSGRAIFEHISEPAVRCLVDHWLREVSLGLVSLIHSCAPTAVVLGGGIFQQDGLVAEVDCRLRPLLKPSFRQCRLLKAGLGNHAGMMGAGFLAKKLFDSLYCKEK